MMGLEDSMTSNLSRGPVLLRRFLLSWALALSVALSPYAAQPLMAQAAAAAQPAIPSGVELVTSVEGITEYRLANGLTVLLFPDPSKQTITVNMTYMVGSRHENYGETGMAHLLEHLLFKGTPRHPNIPQELTEHGARPNGSTWYDRTNYFETFAATEENLRWALDLEADRMVNSFVAKKDLDSEMTVVRNEFERGENSPLDVLFDRVMSTAYLWHNYGKSTIGSRADLENVPIERLQAFYRMHYQPDNATLLVAGKFDEAQTLGLVNQYFGVIPRPDADRCRTSTPRSRRRTASAASRCAAWAMSNTPPSATTSPPARIPTTPPSACWCRSSATSRRDACTRRWSRPRKRRARAPSISSCTIRELRCFPPKSGRSPRSTPRATACCRRSTTS